MNKWPGLTTEGGRREAPSDLAGSGAEFQGLLLLLGVESQTLATDEAG